MSAITWDDVGKRLYETGVDHVVLYLQGAMGVYENGVAWNGVTAINEAPSGGEANPQYADNIKYLNLMSLEEYKATIEAYTYPEEFEACDGSAELSPGVYIGQQNHAVFGLSYRTKVGNDTKGVDNGYKLHLVWGCQAAPSERNYATVNDSPEAMTMSWEVSTTSVPVTGHGHTASLVIDSTKNSAEKMKAIEDVLYGAASNARLPLPDEVKTLIDQAGA